MSSETFFVPLAMCWTEKKQQNEIKSQKWAEEVRHAQFSVSKKNTEKWSHMEMNKRVLVPFDTIECSTKHSHWVWKINGNFCVREKLSASPAILKIFRHCNFLILLDGLCKCLLGIFHDCSRLFGIYDTILCQF
jgi:hypothetical protein